MENASKALIYAGAILLAILIIALGIYIYNVSKGMVSTDRLSNAEKESFNATFLKYEGRVLGVQVKSLIRAVIDNSTKNSNADNRLVDVCYIESRKGNKEVINNIGATPGVGAVRGFWGKNGHFIGSEVNHNGEYYAKSLGMNTEDGGTSFSIRIESQYLRLSDDNNPLPFLNKLCNVISDTHYYQVGCHIFEKTGLVDVICIKY